jgi:hypothetical protein
VSKVLYVDEPPADFLCQRLSTPKIDSPQLLPTPWEGLSPQTTISWNDLAGSMTDIQRRHPPDDFTPVRITQGRRGVAKSLRDLICD